MVGERCNLVARLEGDKGRPVLLLNGHTDTVPPYDMNDPFIPKIEGDKIYGRGSADMKGALAAMMSTLASIRRSGARLQGDVVFVATIGEEEYSPGALHLVESGLHADYAIVGENTELKIGTAHKGVLWGEAVFEGRSVHGSVPDKGVNAIYQATRWIEKIRTEYVPSLQRKRHPLLGSPTINIGVISGGTRPVIVPDRCSVKFERRMIPGESKDTVIGELQNTVEELSRGDPELKGHVREMPVFRGVPHPPLESDPQSPLVAALMAAYQEECGEGTAPCGLTYWTDGALLSMIPGIHVVVCGPGSVEQAHSNDEWISRHELHAAHRIYVRAAAQLCLHNE